MLACFFSNFKVKQDYKCYLLTVYNPENTRRWSNAGLTDQRQASIGSTSRVCSEYKDQNIELILSYIYRVPYG